MHVDTRVGDGPPDPGEINGQDEGGRQDPEDHEGLSSAGGRGRLARTGGGDRGQGGQEGILRSPPIPAASPTAVLLAVLPVGLQDLRHELLQDEVRLIYAAKKDKIIRIIGPLIVTYTRTSRSKCFCLSTFCMVACLHSFSATAVPASLADSVAFLADSDEATSKGRSKKDNPLAPFGGFGRESEAVMRKWHLVRTVRTRRYLRLLLTYPDGEKNEQ